MQVALVILAMLAAGTVVGAIARSVVPPPVKRQLDHIAIFVGPTSLMGWVIAFTGGVTVAFPLLAVCTGFAAGVILVMNDWLPPKWPRLPRSLGLRGLRHWQRQRRNRKLLERDY